MRPLSVKQSESVTLRGSRWNGLRVAAAVSTRLKAGVNQKKCAFVTGVAASTFKSTACEIRGAASYLNASKNSIEASH